MIISIPDDNKAKKIIQQYLAPGEYQCFDLVLECFLAEEAEFRVDVFASEYDEYNAELRDDYVAEMKRILGVEQFTQCVDWEEVDGYLMKAISKVNEQMCSGKTEM